MDLPVMAVRGVLCLAALSVGTTVFAFADAVVPSVTDVVRPLPPGAVRLDGVLGECLSRSRDNWCLGDVPVREFALSFRDGRKMFAMGEMWGKFVRSMAMFYRYRPDAELKRRMDETISEVLSFQRENGSVSCTDVGSQPDSAGGDIWERKYVMLAMERYLEAGGDLPGVLDSLRRQADCLLAQIGEGEGKKPITELGWSFNHLESATVLEPIMRLYRMTGERRYLDFAAYIVRTGGSKGYDIIRQAHDRVPPHKMGGRYPKAYEMLSLFEGLAEYYRVTGDAYVREAVLALFESVLANEITIVGNGGGDAPHHFGVQGEGWDDTAHEQTNSRMTRMMETCTGVTWMKFCSQVLRLTGDPRAADAIEKYVYNGLIGAMRPNGRGFSYVNLLNGNKVTNRGWGWNFGSTPVTCCNLNGPTGLAYIPFVAVMESAEGPVVNLYEPLSADTARAKLVIAGDFPVGERVTLTLDEVRGEGLFAMKLRLPAWSEKTSVTVNGVPVDKVRPGEYLALRRDWKAGDRVELTFDLRTRLVQAPQGTDPRSADFQAVVRGPVVLARDERFDPAFDRPVRIRADETGVVSARRVDAPAGYRLALDVPIDSGTVRLVDYASVDCWDGNRVMTWLPLPVPEVADEPPAAPAVVTDFSCSSADFNALHARWRQAFLASLGARRDAPVSVEEASGEADVLNFDVREHLVLAIRGFPDAVPVAGPIPVADAVALPLLMEKTMIYYGDLRALKRYDECAAWIRRTAEQSPDGLPLRPGASFRDVVLTHEFVRLTERFADRIERVADRRAFEIMRDRVAAAFADRFVRDGRVGRETQAELALALQYGLLTGDARSRAERTLLAKLADGGLDPASDWLALRATLLYLSDHGHADVAGRALLRGGLPEPQDGAVEEWLLRNVLGLSVVHFRYGMDSINVRPNAVGGVTWIKGRYETIRATVRLGWHLDEQGKMVRETDVPWGIWGEH